jgi:phospholipid-translocating ATPase
MVKMEVTTWYVWIIVAEVCMVVFFVASVLSLGDVLTGDFVWRVAVISAVSLIRSYVMKVTGGRLRLLSYARVQRI